MDPYDAVVDLQQQPRYLLGCARVFEFERIVHGDSRLIGDLPQKLQGPFVVARDLFAAEPQPPSQRPTAISGRKQTDLSPR